MPLTPDDSTFLPIQDQSKKPQKKKGEWDETIKTVIYAILIAMVFRSIFFEPFHIPSGSMKGNLLIGDYLFVSKYSYGYSRYSFPYGFAFDYFDGRVLSDTRPERGEIAVFRPPNYPDKNFIKRVIGLPGDRIQMRNGLLYINGEQVLNEYVDDYIDNDRLENNVDKQIPRYLETLPNGKKYYVLKETTEGFANNTPVYVVPDGHYFMMGDNRDNSRDSRFTREIGFIPEENLIGRAEIILLSSGGDAPFYQPWKWLPGLRLDRFFQVID